MKLRKLVRFLYGPDAGGDLGPPPQDFEEPMDSKVLVEGVDEIPQDDPVDDESGYGAKSKEELIELVRRNEEEARKLRENSALGESIAAGFQNLSKELKSNQGVHKEQTVAPKQPTETQEQYLERVREEILENPVKVLDEYATKKLGPIITELVGGNLAMSRRFMEIDPEDGTFFKKHQEEIDKYVKSLPDHEKLKDKNVYKRATRIVKMDHFDELVNEKVEAALNKKVEGNSNVSVQRGYSESSVNPRPMTVKRQSRVLTREEAKKAEMIGLTHEVYFDYLQRKGLK